MKSTRVRFVRRTATAVACAAVLLPLTACNDSAVESDDAGKGSQGTHAGAKPNGVDKLAAKEIYDKGMQANADAGSFREQMQRSDAKSDLRLSATECVGKVDLLQHGSFEVIRKDSDIWGKVDAAFAAWAKENGEVVPADKWMHGGPENTVMKALSSYCHHEQFTKPDTADVEMTKGPVTRVGGASVVPITQKEAGKSRTYYVATTGTPNVVKEDSTTGGQAPDLVFSEFGVAVGAKAPAGPIVEAPQG
ncbi:hypothetical protein [Streptomyces palmae]|uniref:Lipoprotein n=1 Tax=Streptomyces palmae TaxID=1701085 RepID=A0A4Z0H1V9_9ACTN|nr:hypothetical protein [Streptomyces palmae]TGB03245.1 hypothetical protein E4099_19785 [Streptomyces palmae]